MSSKPIRIMFVDDDLVTGKIMKRNCDHAKYSCEVFQDAETCLTAFQDQGADVLITDLRMPGMNGFDLLSNIREVDQEVPVLVMTGYSSVENAVEAMRRGATDFIKKPFDFEELFSAGFRTILSLDRNEHDLFRGETGELVSTLFALPNSIPPEPEEVEIYEERLPEAVEYVMEKVSEDNGAVLVHCYAGNDRTGGVLTGYLSRTRDIPPSQALDLVREANPEAISAYGYEEMILEILTRDFHRRNS